VNRFQNILRHMRRRRQTVRVGEAQGVRRKIAPEKSAAILSLDDIGILCGTDKSSLRQNYLCHYERLLNHLRDAAFNLVEIGVHNGASLRTWARYFVRAQIVGHRQRPAGRAPCSRVHCHSDRLAGRPRFPAVRRF
jgi:hypothetical protein